MFYLSIFYIKTTKEVNTAYFQSKCRLKNDKSFYPLLLLLSGDASLNPGPFSSHQLFKQEEWQAFSNRGLDLIHWNIISLLLKIDELIDIAQPWELVAAFGNAILNAVLCWFYNNKRNVAVKVFTYAVFLFMFYSVVDNSWKISLQLA